MEHAWENLRDEAHSVGRAGQLALRGTDRRSAMEVKYERCCGIDVHKKTVVACVIVPGAKRGEVEKATQT